MTPGHNDPSEMPPRNRRGLLITIAVSLLLFVGLAVAIRELPQVVALDRAALVALSETRSEPMDTVMRTLTFLGSTACIGALAVTVGGFLLWSRYYRALSQVLLACLGS